MIVAVPSSNTTDHSLTVELDEALFPKDAIFGAAYTFIDRCYMHLERPAAGKVSVRFTRKESVETPLESLAGDFENELLGQAWRRLIVEENRQLIEEVTSRAVAGAAGPPGLDDLLGMDIDDDSAFEDPLGIAMSWEEKYKKKGEVGEAPAGAPAAPNDEEKASR